MITKIDFIKNFGIYKNFEWNNIIDIENFKEKNIIYGWNYSGKTTLSRIFSSLRDKTIHNSYKNGLFKLSCDNISYDKTNLATFPYEVLVFNAEYAKENLRWEFDENINAIFFEVGNNAKISSEIDRLNKLIDLIIGTSDIKGKKENLEIIIQQYEDFENLFTIEAGRIKNDSFSSLIEFNKGHLKKIRDKIIPDLEKYIIKSKPDLEKITKTVKIENAKPKIENINFKSSYEQIIELTKAALSSIPSKSNIIKILDDDPKAYNWAKKGLEIHELNDNCKFCGNQISNAKYKNLLNYFENESSKLKQDIDDILILIAEEEIILKELNIPLSINDLNENFQYQFTKLETSISKEINNYKKHLNKITKILQSKYTGKIYSKINFDTNGNINTLKSVDSFNQLINENNIFFDDFDKIMAKERDHYKNHLVALYLKNAKYLSKKNKYEKAKNHLEILDQKVKKYTNEIFQLNSSKESDAAGSILFNSFIQSFLSRDDIEIRLNSSTKKFNLMRGSELAENLSEGEKMAISFSHFFVNLKSIEEKGKLNNYIVYIDDPISSLDSNHIFQINSLLKEIFFDKIIIDPTKPQNLQWVLKCKQLFVSTHNLEFLNLLKELPKKGAFNNKESKYFIARNKNEAEIQKLPAIFSTISSEYHFLFGEILEFTKNPNRTLSPKLFTIPNVVRRFLEMYTLTKYPNMKEEVDGRAEVVFGKKESKRILKLLHYFSHFNNLDRLQTHSNFVSDIEHACDDLIELIKTNDKLHYDALEASTIK